MNSPIVTDFSGAVTTVAAVLSNLGAAREQSLGVSLCTADGFCIVYSSAGSLDEARAKIEASDFPVAMVTLCERFGARYSRHQADASWPAWEIVR